MADLDLAQAAQVPDRRLKPEEFRSEAFRRDAFERERETDERKSTSKGWPSRLIDGLLMRSPR